MYKLIKNALTNEDLEFYAKVNNVNVEQVSRDVIEIEGCCTKIILKGVKRSGCVRDYGNAYIVPRYSRFDRIIKQNWEIQLDVNI